MPVSGQMGWRQHAKKNFFGDKLIQSDELQQEKAFFAKARYGTEFTISTTGISGGARAAGACTNIPIEKHSNGDSRMQQINRKAVTKSVQLALMASAGTGLASLSMPALAQDASDEEAANLDRVQVTGSRISRVDIEGANPVTVLDRDDIKRTGQTDLGEILQNLPMMSGSPVSSSRNNGGTGRVAVDIRGLGTNRTLVLVNGRRLPSLFNDLSVIPVVMVERIEILKDGASAIYGADAVAGVVNIITRRDFEGAEFEFQIGESFDVGGQNTSISFITGGNSDRGNFVVGVEYVEQDSVLMGDYDTLWVKQAVTVYDAEEFAEYGFSGEPWEDQSGNGRAGWASFGSSRVPYGRFDLREWNPDATSWTICEGSAGGGSLTTDYGPRGGDCNIATYDYAPVNYMQQPYERSSFFFQADYELFEHVNSYMEARFSNRTSEQLLAPQPYDTRFDPSYADLVTGVAISKDNFYNPFGANVVEWRRRMVETGGRSFQQNVDQWQIVVGLQGDFATTWSWDLSYNYGKNERTDPKPYRHWIKMTRYRRLPCQTRVKRNRLHNLIPHPIGWHDNKK